jgi:glycosyltransferase involved in cell wall biosynthesis
MLKLVIVIPAFNEKETLGETLRDLPERVVGFDSLEVLVVDDGSTDRTGEIARSAGAHVVRHSKNRGLARTFITGTRQAVAMGADVIVTTDADNQYSAADIPLLVAPILEGSADLVVGARPVAEIRSFSPAKRVAQRVGSALVRAASNTTVPDAPSGFRAMTAATAMRLDVHNDYTYTLETLIQAGRMGLDVRSVPIRVNGYRRPSRLMRWWPFYVVRSAATILRIAVLYRPFRFFGALGGLFGSLGSVLIIRFLVFYLQGRGGGHVQSLVIGTALVAVATQVLVAGYLADAIAANGRIVREIRDRLSHVERTQRD